MHLCLLQGKGCSPKALLWDAGGGLTIIKTSCKVMMGLAWHPGEAEALAALGCIPRLDRAHLECGNTLDLEAKDRHQSQPHGGAIHVPRAGDTQVWQHGSTVPPQTPWGWRALQAS